MRIIIKIILIIFLLLLIAGLGFIFYKLYKILTPPTNDFPFKLKCAKIDEGKLNIGYLHKIKHVSFPKLNIKYSKGSSPSSDFILDSSSSLDFYYSSDKRIYILGYQPLCLTRWIDMNGNYIALRMELYKENDQNQTWEYNKEYGLICDHSDLTKINYVLSLDGKNIIVDNYRDCYFNYQWNIESTIFVPFQGGSVIALQNVGNGNVLSYCHNCYGKEQPVDGVFTNISYSQFAGNTNSSKELSLWKIKDYGNGTIGLVNVSTGLFLTPYLQKKDYVGAVQKEVLPWTIHSISRSGGEWIIKNVNLGWNLSVGSNNSTYYSDTSSVNASIASTSTNIASTSTWKIVYDENPTPNPIIPTPLPINPPIISETITSKITYGDYVMTHVEDNLMMVNDDGKSGDVFIINLVDGTIGLSGTKLYIQCYSNSNGVMDIRLNQQKTKFDIMALLSNGKFNYGNYCVVPTSRVELVQNKNNICNDYNKWMLK